MAQAVAWSCAAIRRLARASQSPLDANRVAYLAVVAEHQLLDSRERRLRQAEAARAVKARVRRHRQIVRLWQQRPALQRTAAGIGPFYDWLWRNRRDLLPQSPLVSELHILLGPLTVTTPAGGGQ